MSMPPQKNGSENLESDESDSSFEFDDSFLKRRSKDIREDPYIDIRIGAQQQKIDDREKAKNSAKENLANSNKLFGGKKLYVRQKLDYLKKFSEIPEHGLTYTSVAEKIAPGFWGKLFASSKDTYNAGAQLAELAHLAGKNFSVDKFFERLSKKEQGKYAERVVAISRKLSGNLEFAKRFERGSGATENVKSQEQNKANSPLDQVGRLKHQFRSPQPSQSVELQQTEKEGPKSTEPKQTDDNASRLRIGS